MSSLLLASSSACLSQCRQPARDIKIGPSTAKRYPNIIFLDARLFHPCNLRILLGCTTDSFYLRWSTSIKPFQPLLRGAVSIGGNSNSIPRLLRNTRYSFANCFGGCSIRFLNDMIVDAVLHLAPAMGVHHCNCHSPLLRLYANKHLFVFCHETQNQRQRLSSIFGVDMIMSQVSFLLPAPGCLLPTLLAATSRSSTCSSTFAISRILLSFLS
jgi:hypothetical protein